MAQSKTQTQKRIIDYLILAMVIAGITLALTDIAANVATELSSRQSQSEFVAPVEDTFPTPTISPEEYRKFLQEKSVGGG